MYGKISLSTFKKIRKVEDLENIELLSIE